MLVISRKVGQEVVIRIGDREVRVGVCAMKPGANPSRVSLYFDADKDVQILRQEIAGCRTATATTGE